MTLTKYKIKTEQSSLSWETLSCEQLQPQNNSHKLATITADSHSLANINCLCKCWDVEKVMLFTSNCIKWLLFISTVVIELTAKQCW